MHSNSERWIKIRMENGTVNSISFRMMFHIFFIKFHMWTHLKNVERDRKENCNWLLPKIDNWFRLQYAHTWISISLSSFIRSFFLFKLSETVLFSLINLFQLILNDIPLEIHFKMVFVFRMKYFMNMNKLVILALLLLMAPFINSLILTCHAFDKYTVKYQK